MAPALQLISSKCVPSRELQRIREFTAKDPKLRSCHHFCFDFRLGNSSKVEFVVVGMNPGETEWDRKMHPGPAEESFDHDYRSGVNSPSRERWFNTCTAMLGGRGISLTELCFWSSPNIQSLRERLGKDLTPYLEWCSGPNKALIEHHKPRAVIAPGLGLLSIARTVYGLEAVNVVRGSRGRLIEHWKRGDMPWIFTKHWSGAFGFSRADREAIRDYISRLED